MPWFETPPQVSVPAILLLGLVAGSFVGLCVYRMPRRKTLIFGFSSCDFCQTPLAWWEKLPLAGYFILRGRTRCCYRRIPGLYPALEIGFAGFFLLASLRSSNLEGFLSATVFTGFLVAGALIDAAHRLLPDRLTFSGLLAALACSLFLRTISLEALVLGGLATSGYLLIGYFISKPLIRRRPVLGGGDIKFAAMIGAFLGFERGLLAIFSACAAGALAGVFRIIVSPSFRENRQMPLGPFLAIGALLALAAGGRLIQWYFGGPLQMALK